MTGTRINLDELRRIAEAANGHEWVLEHRASGCGPGDDEQAGVGWDWQQGPPMSTLDRGFARWADAEHLMAFQPAEALELITAVEAVCNYAERLLRLVQIMAHPEEHKAHWDQYDAVFPDMDTGRWIGEHSGDLTALYDDLGPIDPDDMDCLERARDLEP